MLADQNNDTLLANLPSLPAGTPVVMLNLLQFTEKAQYPSTSTLASVSGQQAYLERYVPAFRAVAAAQNINVEILYKGVPNAFLVGVDSDKWDFVALVKYPSVEAFRSIAGSEEYKKTALEHRQASLKDFRLYATTEVAG